MVCGCRNLPDSLARRIASAHVYSKMSGGLAEEWGKRNLPQRSDGCVCASLLCTLPIRGHNLYSLQFSCDARVWGASRRGGRLRRTNLVYTVADYAYMMADRTCVFSRCW